MKRGEIYWFNMDDFCKHDNFKTKVLLKKRPYLIVSNEDWNNLSGLVTVVPISSKERFNSPSHVHFKLEKSSSVIITEHITTIDQYLLGDYIDSVSEDVMLQVEKAIQNHLAIKIENDTNKELNNFFCSSTDILEIFSSMIDKILKKKFEEERKKLMSENVDNVALRLASTIEDLFDTNNSTYSNSNIEVSNNIDDNKNSIIDTKEDTLTKIASKDIANDIDEDTKKKSKKTKVKKLKLPRDKNSRILWTPETKKEFVENSHKYSTEEMCIMYNYISKGSYYSSLHAIKKSLKKTENLVK